MTAPFERAGVKFRPFALGTSTPSTSTDFWVGKDPSLFDQWVGLLEQHRGAVIVEVGIFEGGSTALCALVAEPTRLVCIELEPDVPPMLAEMVHRHGLGDRVRIHTGIDQADRERVRAVIDLELGDTPIDLIVDDASHQYEATVDTFEELFPRLRPGGSYIIEDWTWEVEFVEQITQQLDDEVLRDQVGPLFAAAATDPDHPASAVFGDLHRIATAATANGDDLDWAPVFSSIEAPPTPPTPPLALLIQQLLLSQATGSGVVAGLRTNPGWVEVIRGAAPIDPATFRVRDLYRDWYELLGSWARRRGSALR